jgi:hypothetical protein
MLEWLFFCQEISGHQKLFFYVLFMSVSLPDALKYQIYPVWQGSGLPGLKIALSACCRVRGLPDCGLHSPCAA